jgi:uncharacterized protein YacL
MLNKIFRWLITAVGLVAGFAVTDALISSKLLSKFINIESGSVTKIIFLIFGILIFGLIFYLIAPLFIKLVWKVTDLLESGIQKLPTNDIIIGVAGLLIGLLIATLIVSPFGKFFTGNAILTIVGGTLTFVVYIVFGTLGVNIALKKKEDLSNVFTSLKKFGKDKKNKGEGKLGVSQPKILDTSVIIDGRIFDILKTGFVDGTIVIPSFVLEELRHIADSSDVLKRTRGRRGLDILNMIQKELLVPVEISERDFEGIQEVDSKLLKLCQVMNGKVITNDFNLNKVAEFQGVPVLNINELANAVKPVVIPGEEMHISIVKDGKESGQGVAYLDDGTMIVVEGGKKFVGELIDVIVTSVLQTAA